MGIPAHYNQRHEPILWRIRSDMMVALCSVCDAILAQGAVMMGSYANAAAKSTG